MKVLSETVPHRDKPLSKDEKKLCGILLRKWFREKDATGSTVKTLQIYDGTKARSMKVALIPEVYDKGKSDTTRTWNRHMEVVTDWMTCLPGGMNDKVMSYILESQPKLAKRSIVKYYNKNLRLSAQDTASVQSFVRFNLEQMDRFARSFAFYSSGLRIFCPRDDF